MASKCRHDERGRIPTLRPPPSASRAASISASTGSNPGAVRRASDCTPACSAVSATAMADAGMPICTMSSRRDAELEEISERFGPRWLPVVDCLTETLIADGWTPEARASRRDRATWRRRGGHLRRRPGDEHARLAQGALEDAAPAAAARRNSSSAFSSGPRTSRTELGADTLVLGDRGGARRSGPRPRVPVEPAGASGLKAPGRDGKRPRGRGTPRAVAAGDGRRRALGEDVADHRTASGWVIPRGPAGRRSSAGSRSGRGTLLSRIWKSRRGWRRER